MHIGPLRPGCALQCVGGPPVYVQADCQCVNGSTCRQWAVGRKCAGDVFSNRKGAPVRSHPAALPMFRLDRIFVRGVKVRRTEVHFGQPCSAISDHAALSAGLARDAR